MSRSWLWEHMFNYGEFSEDYNEGYFDGYDYSERCMSNDDSERDYDTSDRWGNYYKRFSDESSEYYGYDRSKGDDEVKSSGDDYDKGFIAGQNDGIRDF